MRDEVKMACNTIARRACVFNFLPFFTSRCFLAGLSRKLKEKFLRDLPPGRRPYGSYGPEAATRAKRAVNQCLNDNELLSNSRRSDKKGGGNDERGQNLSSRFEPLERRGQYTGRDSIIVSEFRSPA